jgi:hypothetical protein
MWQSVFLCSGRRWKFPPGCEPNLIDEREFQGTAPFLEEMNFATDLMRSLSGDERRGVIVYDQLEHPDMPEGFPHPADVRNLAGPY